MYYLNLQVPHGIQKASKIDIPGTEAEIDQGTHRDGCTGCDQCKSTSKFESTPFWRGTLDYMQIKGRYTKGQIFEEDNCWRDVSFLLYSFLFYFLRVLIRSWSCLTCLSFLFLGICVRFGAKCVRLRHYGRAFDYAKLMIAAAGPVIEQANHCLPAKNEYVPWKRTTWKEISSSNGQFSWD